MEENKIETLTAILNKKMEVFKTIQWNQNTFSILCHQVKAFNLEHDTEFVVLKTGKSTQIMHIDRLVRAYEMQAFIAFKATLKEKLKQQQYLTLNDNAQIFTEA